MAKRTAKPRALTNAERLAGPPLPMPILQPLTSVRVYMGGQWLSGLVAAGSTDQSCPVWLTQGQRHTVVYDRRNLILSDPTP